VTNGNVLVVRDTPERKSFTNRLARWSKLQANRQAPIVGTPGQTQHGSLLSFVDDTYLNDMGITDRPRPTDVTTVLKTTKDPEFSARWPGLG
jgi:hypothetical protein